MPPLNKIPVTIKKKLFGAFDWMIILLFFGHQLDIKYLIKANYFFLSIVFLVRLAWQASSVLGTSAWNNHSITLFDGITVFSYSSGFSF